MEKLIVEATKPHPSIFGHIETWKYASVPGYEVLSLCDESITYHAFKHLGDALDIDRQFVPQKYLGSAAVPQTFIMFNNVSSRAMQALIPSMLTEEQSPEFAHVDSVTMALGGLDTADYDTHCVVQNRSGFNWPWAGAGLGRGPVPTGLLFEMSRVRPALPLWYKMGFIGPCGLLRTVFYKTGLLLAPVAWPCDKDVKEWTRAWENVHQLPPLPPLANLFKTLNPSERDGPTRWPDEVWMAEAALFLRWGIYGAPGSDVDRQQERKGFEEFVERSRYQVVTEDMFRSCFGFSIEKAQKDMELYFITSLGGTIQIPYNRLRNWIQDPAKTRFAGLEVRDATDGEIARMIGDWERMQAFSVRHTNPALSDLYSKQAGITLHKRYEQGDRDPRLFAILGLYAKDTNSRKEAREFLENAAAAEVVRPEAYVSLAQLRFDDWASSERNPNTGLSPDELAEILKPLFHVRDRWGLESEGYRLIASAWLRSASKPSLGNLNALKEGLDLYPFDTSLRLEVAKCFERWSFSAEAKTIVENGINQPAFVALGPEFKLRTSAAKKVDGR